MIENEKNNNNIDNKPCTADKHYTFSDKCKNIHYCIIYIMQHPLTFRCYFVTHTWNMEWNV